MNIQQPRYCAHVRIVSVRAGMCNAERGVEGGRVCAALSMKFDFQVVEVDPKCYSCTSLHTSYGYGIQIPSYPQLYVFFTFLYIMPSKISSIIVFVASAGHAAAVVLPSLCWRSLDTIQFIRPEKNSAPSSCTCKNRLKHVKVMGQVLHW